MSKLFILICWISINLVPAGGTNAPAAMTCQQESTSTAQDEIDSGQSTPSSQVTGEEYQSTVGFPAMIRQLVITGSELQAKPIEDREQPIVVRIVDTYPHGSDWRYDIEFYGLEPGRYDLREYLVRADGSPLGEIPPIQVEVKPILKSGQIVPHEIEPEQSFFGSYYLPILLGAGIVWLVGLFIILFAGRSKAYRATGHKKIVTVADRLKPLIEKAVNGSIEPSEKAELERVLDAFWRKRLNAKHLPANELRKKMRNHSDASNMLSQMDNWLHAPEPDTSVDIVDLLEPYQSMNLDEI